MKKWLIRIVIVILLVAIGAVLFQIRDSKRQLKEQYISYRDSVIFYLDGEPIKDSTLLIEEANHYFVALDLVSADLPQPHRLSLSKQRLLFGVASLNRTGLSQAQQNQLFVGDFELNLPLVYRSGTHYIDIAYLPYFADIEYVAQGGILQLYRQAGNYQFAYLNSEQALLIEPESSSPTIDTLSAESRVSVLGYDGSHAKVISEFGDIGYLHKSAFRDVYSQTATAFPAYDNNASLKYGKWQMSFDHLSDYQAVYQALPQQKIEGLDVLMPTLFKLTVDGWVLNNADLAYIEQAHQLGYQVHALFDNNFDPELTQAMLTDETLMNRVVDQLGFYARFYALEGINVDFENVNLADGPLYTEFIKKLGEKLRAIGAKLSVDVTRPGGSDNWSKFIDRKTISDHCDYIILMAYDEHWASSPVAGSVASLSWTEESIQLTLAEVPEDKLILGVPTYMRVWRLAGSGDAATVSSNTLSMRNLSSFVQKYSVFKEYDTNTGQNYYEMVDQNGDTLKIWAEDETSVTARVKLVNSYDIAGIASWRLGFENDLFWRIINEEL